MAGVRVVLSPNLLLDNPAIISMLASPAVQRWLKSDQHDESKLMIRGFNLEKGLSLVDYFADLKDSYVISQLGGVHKSDLTGEQLSRIQRHLEKADTILRSYEPSIASLPKRPGALTEQIRSRLAVSTDLTLTTEIEEPEAQRIAHQQVLALVEQGGLPLGSRSEWYRALGQLELSTEQRDQFRLEVVDASYNALFVDTGEAFVMDRMVGLSRLPQWLLQTGVSITSRREEIRTLKAGYELFNLITTLGSEEIIKVVADKALEYAEDKAKERGISWCERRNWFGLYPKLTRVMGVELKS